MWTQVDDSTWAALIPGGMLVRVQLVNSAGSAYTETATFVPGDAIILGQWIATTAANWSNSNG